MKVVDPRGTTSKAAAGNETQPLSLAGQTIGLLWNGKKNADNLLRILEQRLRSDFGVADSLWINKSVADQGPGLPAGPDTIDRLASGTVAVLAASGD